jgi:CBS domain-containing protein
VNPHYASSSLIKISSKDTALAGFTLVYENQKTHAVAVVTGEETGEGEGRLLANISASDLRGITSDALPSLLLPIEEFLRRISWKINNGNEEEVEEKADKLPHPVTCSSRATLGEVLEQIITAKVHRVWVVDSAQRPLHAITLEEILHVLIE